jgi:hypothetical protein
MYPWTKDKVKYFKDTWSGWSATGAKLMMRPNFTLDGHSFPLAYYRHYAECYDFIRANGLVAVDMDSLTGVYGANGLTLFVIASKNSSPDRALKDLEEDYFSAFGSAAGAMRECCEDFVKAADAGFMLDGKDDTIEGGRYTEFMLSAYRVFPPALIEKAIARLEAAKSAARDEVVVRRLEFVLAGLVEARLMLKTQRGFAKYQKCGDFADFSAGYKELIAHRRQNEALGFLNMKTVDFFESRLWPRHLGLLNAGARELNGWELKLNADIFRKLLAQVKRNILDVVVKILRIYNVKFAFSAIGEFECLGDRLCLFHLHGGFDFGSLCSFAAVTRGKNEEEGEDRDHKDKEACFFHSKPHFIGLFSIYSSSILAARRTASRQGRL